MMAEPKRLSDEELAEIEKDLHLSPAEKHTRALLSHISWLEGENKRIRNKWRGTIKERDTLYEMVEKADDAVESIRTRLVEVVKQVEERDPECNTWRTDVIAALEAADLGGK